MTFFPPLITIGGLYKLYMESSYPSIRFALTLKRKREDVRMKQNKTAEALLLM